METKLKPPKNGDKGQSCMVTMALGASASTAPLPILAPSLLTPTSEHRKQILPHCATLVNLIHARNRNQHRCSPWYRHFSVFRRELIRLCEDLDIPIPHNAPREHTPSVNLPRSTAKKAKPNKARSESRLQFWMAAGLPLTWHDTFTHLITTTQYSPIGLLLLSVLARVCAVTGIINAIDRSGSPQDIGSLRVRKTEQTVGTESGDSSTEILELQSSLNSSSSHDTWRIPPESKEQYPSSSKKQDTDTTDRRTIVLANSKNKKRKKIGMVEHVHQDAIDALFADL